MLKYSFSTLDYHRVGNYSFSSLIRQGWQIFLAFIARLAHFSSLHRQGWQIFLAFIPTNIVVSVTTTISTNVVVAVNVDAFCPCYHHMFPKEHKIVLKCFPLLCKQVKEQVTSQTNDLQILFNITLERITLQTSRYN